MRKKGGAEGTDGRKCICNGLMANIGLGQVDAHGGQELPLVTCGDDVKNLVQFLKTPEALSYSAREVVNYLLSFVKTKPSVAPC